MHLSFDLNLTSRQSGASCLPAPTLALEIRSLHRPGEDKCWSELYQTIRGVRKGARGHVPSQCPPPIFPMLEIFSLNSAECVTLNRIFSMFIGFLEASPLDPIQGSDRVWTPLGTDGTPFVPVRNKFLATPLQAMPVGGKFWSGFA